MVDGAAYMFTQQACSGWIFASDITNIYRALGFYQVGTPLKMSCYSSITMCQYWDNWLIYWDYTDYFTNMSQ